MQIIQNKLVFFIKFNKTFIVSFTRSALFGICLGNKKITHRDSEDKERSNPRLYVCRLPRIYKLHYPHFIYISLFETYISLFEIYVSLFEMYVSNNEM